MEQNTRLRKKEYKDEPVFEKKRIDGYCDSFQKLIVFCDLDTFDRWDDESDMTKRECEKEILRHEITHAFLTENGLADSSNPTDGAWAKNEEMVDWFAIQSPKNLQGVSRIGYFVGGKLNDFGIQN